MRASSATRVPHRHTHAHRVFALLCALTLSALTFVLPAAQRAQAAEAGVNLPNPSPGQAATVRTLGAHWVRVFATWPDLEPARGSYAENWFAYYENLFASLPRGTKVIVDVVEAPSWETGSSNARTAPANPTDFGAFVGVLAQRWRGRVAAYEIWNEEDTSAWWAGGPDPGAYAALLRATYPFVKSADPGATVVLGGLTGNDYHFLEGVYAGGGKGSFDAVGVHTDTACNVLSPYEFLRGPDNRMIADSFLAYREVHQTMLANGDEKPIWMTETSWRTTSATCSEGAWAGQKPEGVTLQQQAAYLSQEFHCMREDPYLAVALWFPLQDERGIVSGLIRTNGTQKPSFGAMRSYVQSGDQLTEPCGVFTGPHITVRTPANNVRYSGVLPIHVRAWSSLGVFRITLKVDGRRIRNFGKHSYPTTLVGDMQWFGAHHISFGRHTLTFIAYDKARNFSETSITIIHTRHRR
jgi:Cellulase (glycosyl hydrolase family 5)